MYSMVLFVLNLIIIIVLLSQTNPIVLKYCSFVAIIPLIIYISWLSTDFIRRYLLPNKSIEPKGRSVLITGCDSGFGYATAKRLREKGWHVFSCVLSEWSEGAKNLSSIGCTVVALDVTKESDITNAYDTVVRECAQRDTKLWAVVNNAGVMTCGPIEWSNIQEFNRVFDVNVCGYVRIIRQFLPLIRKSKGRIINISSTSSLFTAPGITTYSMSKYSVSSLSDGLRRELCGTGVSVIEIIPQAYLTQMSFTITGTLDRIWSETSSEVKKDFGEEYFEKFKSYIKYYVKITSNKHNQVLNPIVDSITLKRVYPKYLCCNSVTRLIVWSFNWLPIEWVDPIVPLFTYRATPNWMTKPKNGSTFEV